MIKQFLNFEKKLEITPVEASILLGLRLEKYMKLKSGELEGKKLFDYSIEAHSLLHNVRVKRLLRIRKNRLVNNYSLFNPYPFFTSFEDLLELGPVMSSFVIGLDYPRYNELKNGAVTLQIYHLNAVEGHKLLDYTILDDFKKQRLET